MPNDKIKSCANRHHCAMRLTQVAYIALLATIFYACWTQNIDGIAAKITLWLLLSSGLLLVAKGIAQGLRRSYQWLCFILLLYFVFSVQLLFTGSDRDGGESTATGQELLALLLIVGCFVGAMLTARWQSCRDE